MFSFISIIYDSPWIMWSFLQDSSFFLVWDFWCSCHLFFSFWHGNVGSSHIKSMDSPGYISIFCDTYFYLFPPLNVSRPEHYNSGGERLEERSTPTALCSNVGFLVAVWFCCVLYKGTLHWESTWMVPPNWLAT